MKNDGILKLKPISYYYDSDGAGVIVASHSGQLKGKIYFIDAFTVEEDLSFVYIDEWLLCLPAQAIKNLSID